MFYQNAIDRMMLDEERRLLREVSTQRMSWNKLGKLFKLRAIIRRRNEMVHY